MRNGDAVLPAAGAAHPARGFIYLWALWALAVFALGLAAVVPVLEHRMHRERELELLRVGSRYAEALRSYANASSSKLYPLRLEELVDDQRFAGTVRHLRRLEPDPIDPRQPWGLVRRIDGRIVGVFSQSQAKPLRDQPVQWGSLQLPAAVEYRQWQFLATP